MRLRALLVCVQSPGWRASEGSGSVLRSSWVLGVLGEVEAMCLLGTTDPDASWLHSKLSGMLRSPQLRELSGLADFTLCRFLEECR